MSLRAMGIRRITSSARALSTKPVVRFPETMPETTTPEKPKLRQFRTAFFNTFLIASSAYMLLHALWYRLQLEEAQKEMEAKSAILEKRIQDLVDEKKQTLEANQKWYRGWKWWWASKS